MENTLLTPAQVSGAKGNPVAPALPVASAYDWHSQTASDGPGGPKEGTATGSSGENHLEDWNDK